MNLFACGDIVNFTGNENFIDSKLKGIISSCDFAICNFEAPILTEKSMGIPKTGPHVSQSVKSVKLLKDVGFNIFSIANNHIYDYGEDALDRTLTEFEKYDIDYVGGGRDFKRAYESIVIEQDGVKIGVLAACENEFGCLFEDQNRGGYAWIFHHLIEDEIRSLKKVTDAIIMVVHAGAENINFPIIEWRERYQRLCDVGVDVIIGHHPHVPQGYEKYNDSMIFYSLGNFYFDIAGHENKSNDSYSVILEFEKAGLVDFKIIYHKSIEMTTTLVSKDIINFSIDKLNSYLDDDFKGKNDKLAIQLYQQFYYNYYADAVGGKRINTSVFKNLKTYVRLVLLGDKHNKNLLLLHNIRNDTHRFVVQRALSLMSESQQKPIQKN